MRISYKKLKGTPVNATDGRCGTIHDVLFNDATMKLIYLVIDTGNWLPGRKTLISNQAVEGVNDLSSNFEINLKLSNQQIEKSPPIDRDAPVSRQAEEELTNYFGWSPWSELTVPISIQPSTPAPSVQEVDEKYNPPSPRQNDPNLRSINELIDYSLQDPNEEPIGLVHDLLVDTESWMIAYMAVNTRPWLPGGYRGIPTSQIAYIEFPTQNIMLSMTSDEVGQCPNWKDLDFPLNNQDLREFASNIQNALHR